MEYRKFDNIEKPLSVFGIGCMRLPMIQKDGRNEVNEAEAIRMIRYGIDHGVNYIDTAYGYHGGNSERVVGKALKDGYRNRVFLTTKLPPWQIKEYSDMERILDEQLDKLQTDHVDFYLLHSLHKENWEFLKGLGVLGFMEKVRAKGKIKYIGFSFHDNAELFREIIDSFNWDMCQIQMNIIDMDEQATVDGLKYAGSKNIPVMIMEPLKGGKLANSITPDIEEIWNRAGTKMTPVEWAFRWLYNFPEVAVILSGVSTMEQLKDNLRIFSGAKANCMDEMELSLVDEVRKVYLRKTRVPCTGCEYCLPCPQGVSIPQVFHLANTASMFNDEEGCRTRYQNNLVKDGRDASRCVECGHCESVCPQKISIIEKLKENHIFLAQK